MSKFNYYSRGADFEGVAGGMINGDLGQGVIGVTPNVRGTVWLPSNSAYGVFAHRDNNGQMIRNRVMERFPGVYTLVVNPPQQPQMPAPPPANQLQDDELPGVAGGMMNGNLRQSIVEVHIPHDAMQVFVPGGGQQGAYFTQGPNGQIIEHNFWQYTDDGLYVQHPNRVNLAGIPNNQNPNNQNPQ